MIVVVGYSFCGEGVSLMFVSCSLGKVSFLIHFKKRRKSVIYRMLNGRDQWKDPKLKTIHFNPLISTDEGVEMRPQTMIDTSNGRADEMDGVMLRQSEVRRSGK